MTVRQQVTAIFIFLICLITTGCKPDQISKPNLMLMPIITSTLEITPTVTPTASPTASLTLTSTNTQAPTKTPKPTVTPLPEVDLESFVFPYSVPHVMEVWNQLNVPQQNRHITFKIVNRIDRSIPYENSCGYHPGDLIDMLESSIYYENFLIDAYLPYSGILVDSWITQGNDDGFTFFLGKNDDKKVYLNAYHTQLSHNSINQQFQQGDVFGSLTYTRDHCNCGWYETKVHFTLFNPAPNGGLDFLRDVVNILDITRYALPPTMQAAYKYDLKLLITYEGPNYCDMSPQQKVDAILATYLPNAGYCIDGLEISYCGNNSGHNGERFEYYKWNDARSIMLTPKK